MKKFTIVFILCIPLITVTDASAETISDLTVAMSQKLSNQKSLNEAIVRGSLRVRLCQYCHGKDGNSIKEDIPNLAQQNPVYLLTQFEYFRMDKRKNKVMNELAKGLTEDERINIALYYASQEVKVDGSLINVNSGSYKRGSELYKNICANCHGEKGYGKHTLPRVAGQKYEFLTKTLTAYKHKEGVRPDSPMVAVAAQLSKQDILSVASYTSLMN